MFWPYVLLIAGHSFMFGVAVSALGPYMVDGDMPGLIFNDIPMKETWKQSLATSLTLLGAMLSALSSSVLANGLGKKKTLLFNSLLWIIAASLCAFKHFETFIVGRFVLGLGVGIASAVCPSLLSEISPSSLKGTVTSMHQLNITFGILVIGIASYWMVHVDHGWWWINSIAVGAGGVFLFLTGFSLPESPTWLLQNNKDSEALTTLQNLRKSHDYSSQSSSSLNSPNEHLLYDPAQPTVQSATSELYSYDIAHLQSTHSSQQDVLINQEMQELRIQIVKSHSNGDSDVSWGQIFTKRYRKQIIIGTLLMVLQAFIGINAVTMFATKIFGFAGLKDDNTTILSTQVATIMLYAVGFIMSFVSMQLIERLGRKTLFCVGSIGATVILVALGTTLLAFNAYAKAQGIAAIVLLMSYLFFFNFGLGGVPWALLPEITATKVRSKLISLFCFQNWLANTIVVYLTLPTVIFFGGGNGDAEQKKGAAILFLIFAVVGVITILFGFFVLIETKGLSETQIQTQLGNDEAHSLDIEDDDVYGTAYTKGTIF